MGRGYTSLVSAEEMQIEAEDGRLGLRPTGLAGFALSLLRSLSQRRSSHGAGERS